MPTIMLCAGDPQLSCRNMLTTEGQTGRSCCGRVDVRDTNPAANGMQPSTNAAGARHMLLWMLGTDRDCKRTVTAKPCRLLLPHANSFVIGPAVM